MSQAGSHDEDQPIGQVGRAAVGRAHEAGLATRSIGLLTQPQAGRRCGVVDLPSQVVEMFGKVLDLEGQDDLQHAERHAYQPDGQVGGQERQAGSGQQIERHHNLGDTAGEDHSPVRDEVAAVDGPDDRGGASERQEPSDERFDDEQRRAWPHPDRDADPELDHAVPEHRLRADPSTGTLKSVEAP